MRIIMILFVWLILLGAWADSLPAELAHALQQREHFYHNHYITFIVETQHDIFQPHRYQSRSQYILEIFRAARAVKVTQRPLQGMDHRTKQGNTIQFNLDKNTGNITTTSSCYLGEDVNALMEPDMEFTQSNQSLARAQMGAVIGMSKLQNLYSNPQVSGFICQEVCNQRGVFTIGLDVSKLYGVQWERIEERAHRWIMVGRIKARHYDPQAAEGDPDVTLRVELRKPDALILELEVLRPLRAANKWQRSQFRTVQIKKIDGLSIPAEIEYRADSSSGGYMIRSHYRLVSIKLLSDAVALDLPLGTRVEDRRLGSSVNYLWQGRLPTEEELKRLAFQQGYLLAPESPRRRYSPWLFAPAMIFFAAAGYLYWRQRRK